MVTKEIIQEAMKRGLVKVQDANDEMDGIHVEVVDNEGGFWFDDETDGYESAEDYLSDHSLEHVAGKIADTIESIRQDLNPMEACGYECALRDHMKDAKDLVKDFQAFDTSFIAHHDGKNVEFGEYLSSLQPEAVAQIVEDTARYDLEYDVMNFTYESREASWDALAADAQAVYLAREKEQTIGKTTYAVTLDVCEQELVKGMLSDQLNYWLNESGCPEEYADHISAGIALLNGLGEPEKAADWKNWAEQAIGAASIHAVLREAPDAKAQFQAGYEALVKAMQDKDHTISKEAINKTALSLMRESQEKRTADKSVGR